MNTPKRSKHEVMERAQCELTYIRDDYVLDSDRCVVVK
jgi:hypothetical protein